MIDVTPAAADKIRATLTAQDAASALLRVVAIGEGACTPQYLLALDDEVGEGDVVVARDGVRLVLDERTAELAAGSRIDYVEDGSQSAFFIAGPNGAADGGCGPGCSCA